MRSTRVLTLDCGASHLACALFAVDQRGAVQLERFASENFVVDPSDESRWTEAVGQALQTLLAREDFGVRECVLAVPGHFALTKFVKTPAVERAKRDRIVQFEASQNIPYPLDEVVWDYVEVAEDGVEVELMLAAIKKDALESLCAEVEKAGLTVVGVEPGSLALRRAFLRQTDRELAPTLLVDCGARSTHLLFVSRDGFFARTLPLGGNRVTQTLAEKLRLGFSAAEALKQQRLVERDGMDEVAKIALTEAINDFTERLQLEITRSILGYSRHPGAEMPESILLTGGGSRLPELAETLADKVKLPVAHLEAAAGLKLAPGSGWDESDATSGSLATLVGLVVAHSEEAGEGAMNLLPAERLAARLNRSRQPWWLAAAGLLILALMPPLGYYHWTASKNETRIKEVMRTLTPLNQLETRNRRNLDRLEMLQKQVVLLRDVEKQRDRWPTFLADLQTRLGTVGDVWLERMQLLPPAASTLSSETVETAPLRLDITGRLLDTENPLSKASSDSYAKVKRLIVSLGKSKFVTRVDNERFDNSQPGILKFEVTLVLNSEEAP